MSVAWVSHLIKMARPSNLLFLGIVATLQKGQLLGAERRSSVLSRVCGKT